MRVLTVLHIASVLLVVSVISACVASSPREVRAVPELPKSESVSAERIAELSLLMRLLAKTNCKGGICTVEKEFDIVSGTRAGVLRASLTIHTENPSESSLVFIVEYAKYGIMLIEDTGLDGSVDTLVAVRVHMVNAGESQKKFSMCFAAHKPEICVGSNVEPPRSFCSEMYGTSVRLLIEEMKRISKKDNLET